MSTATDSAPLFDSGPWSRLLLWLDRLTTGARGPALAAALVCISALPALFALPPLDRDESRFAQATAQMLETGDFINIRYQGEPRDKKPAGIHWLQAVSVSVLSSVERREIWAYRIPSILGGMAAAAACAWGASAFFGSRAGFFAGAILGSSFILSSEAFIAKTDAVLCGAVTLSMAALGRIYGASKGVGDANAGTKALFWLGQGVAILDKGPVGPMVAGLALISLLIADRGGAWTKSLGWIWGPILVGVIVGPWVIAITVATDGAFWMGTVNGDLAPKLAGGHETHGAPPGLHALLLPILIFPASFLLPAALVAGWRERLQPGVRFALAWLIPFWIVCELLPTKLVHYTLPAYGALAWLTAAALADPAKIAFGPKAKALGGGLSTLVGVLFAAAVVTLAMKYGGVNAPPWAWVAAILSVATGIIGAVALFRGQIEAGFLACFAVGILTHMTLTSGLAPQLTALWTSDRAAKAIVATHLDPRNGVTTGPVAVIGYAEPSLIFALGTGTELDNAVDGADAVADGQPAIVEKKQDKAFEDALAAEKVVAQPVGEIKGFDYSLGRPVELTLWRSLMPPAKDEAP